MRGSKGEYEDWTPDQHIEKACELIEGRTVMELHRDLSIAHSNLAIAKMLRDNRGVLV